MFTTPPLTKPVRKTVVPLQELKDLHDDTEFQLRQALDKVNSKLLKSTQQDLRIDTVTIQKLWIVFEDSSINLRKSFEKHGSTEESHKTQGIFMALKGEVGKYLKSSSKALKDFGDDNLSKISGFTQASSIQQAEAALNYAECTKAVEDKIEDLELQEKILNLEKEKEKIKLSSEKSKLKRNLQFDAFRSQATELINAIDKESITSEDVIDPEENVVSWILNSFNTNTSTTTRNSVRFQDNETSNDQAYAGCSNYTYKTSSNFQDIGVSSIAGRQPVTLINTRPRCSILNPGASSFQPIVSNPVSSSGIQIPQYVLPSLDPSTRHLAMAELKRTPISPFNGEPYHFKGWLRALNHRMEPLELQSMDVLDILEAHTIGAPRDLVRNYRTSYGRNPDEALKVILEKLEKRYGDDNKVASVLLKKTTRLIRY